MLELLLFGPLPIIFSKLRVFFCFFFCVSALEMLVPVLPEVPDRVAAVVVGSGVVADILENNLSSEDVDLW